MTRWAPGAAVAYAKTLIPGLLVTALVAMAAAFLGSHYKGSVLLFALLLGLALHFISEDRRCAAGIQFASSTVLRFGVALLGLRLSIDHVVSVGWQTAAALMVAVSLTIALGLAVPPPSAVHRPRWPFPAYCPEAPAWSATPPLPWSA
jgi:uncharacterized membrane protein YadS